MFSALPLKADIRQRDRNVRFGPIAEEVRLHIRSANSGAWHTASIRYPSGSRTKAPK